MRSLLSQTSKLPKYYSDFNIKQPKSYWDYENYTIQCGHQDDYEIYSKIGFGKYSEVFRGYNILNHTNVVLKVLKPNSQKKLQREVLVLRNLNTHPLIIKLEDVVQDIGSGRYTLIFDECASINLRQNYHLLTLQTIKFIIKSILEALDYAHSVGIFHRDIKPQNILTDKAFSYCKLIDWGLAEFYLPNQEYNTRVASRFFKSPEILLENRYYHHSIDSWGVGCLMAGMIFQKEPFFPGLSNDDQLIKIVQLLGTDEMYTYVKRHSLTLPQKYSGIKYANKKSLEFFINEDNQKFCTSDALNLLNQLLTFDHSERILPKDALKHPFFN